MHRHMRLGRTRGSLQRQNGRDLLAAKKAFGFHGATTSIRGSATVGRMDPALQRQCTSSDTDGVPTVALIWRETSLSGSAIGRPIRASAVLNSAKRSIEVALTIG